MNLFDTDVRGIQKPGSNDCDGLNQKNFGT